MITVLFVSVLCCRSTGTWIKWVHSISYVTERFFRTKFGFFSEQRERQSMPNRVSWDTNKSTKELQDQRKGRRYLRKNTEAEFAANPYSNVSAL